MKPDPILLETLATFRFRTETSKPSPGLGERRSDSSGAGSEFNAHRPYRPGDDLRRLDPHVRARLGHDVIREYAEARPLVVRIVLDASGSMAPGSCSRFLFAAQIAQLMGFIGLAASDRVQVVAISGSGISWSPTWHAPSKADDLFAWVAGQSASGQVRFDEELASIGAALPAASFVIAIGDWWDTDLERVLKVFAGKGHHLLALHVETAEEADPSRLGEGSLRLADAETGEVLELNLDAAALKAYKSLRDGRIVAMRSALTRRGNHYFRVGAGDDLAAFFTRTLAQSGVIG